MPIELRHGGRAVAGIASIAIAALLLWPAPSRAAEGDLDPSFGSSGKETTPIGTSSDEAEAVALDSQGRIVAAGRAFVGTDEDFALARYSSNGTLDTGFGGGGTGKVTT